MNKIFRYCALLLLFSISACSTLKQADKHSPTKVLTKEQRQQQLAQIKQWQITGKLAFITPERRQSANLFWQLDQKRQSQQLELTSYLGISVLSLTSKNGHHLVEVDGKNYQGNDLEHLIYQLTKLILPTSAMQYWLRGLAWSAQDHILYHAETNLPIQISSFYNGQHWQILFDDYQLVNQIAMAKKITITQGQLTIKLRINQWII